MTRAFLLTLTALFLFQEPPSMEAILKDLDSDSPDRRERAIRAALDRYAAWTSADLENLRAAASSGDRERAARAKAALERIEIRRKAGPRILGRLKDLDTILLQGDPKACAKLLHETSRAVEENVVELTELEVLVDLFVARRIDMRREVFSLTSQYPHRPYVRFLRLLLKFSDPEDEHDCAAAFHRLLRLGGKEEAPRIVPFLKSPSSLLRSCAVSAFKEVPDRALLDPLLPLLNDPDPVVRSDVVQTLATLPARDCAPLIARALKDKHDDVRDAVVNALGAMGAVAHAGSLVPMLRDENSGVRKSAVWALSFMDATAQARDVLPLIEDKALEVSSAALQSLGRLDSKECLGRILPRLGTDKEFRWRAWSSLMSPGARGHVPAVAPLLKHEDDDVRSWAAATLGKMQAADQAGAIAALLKDTDDSVRHTAAHALADLAIHLPREAIDAGWVSALRDFEKAKEKDKWSLSIALVRLGAKSRAEQLDLARRMLQLRGHETTAHYDDLFRGLGEANEPGTSAKLARVFTLRKPVESRADLEALLGECGLNLKGAPGWETRGRSAAGRETTLQELLGRHFPEWTPVPETDAVVLLWWDKAFQHWLRRLDPK